MILISGGCGLDSALNKAAWMFIYPWKFYRASIVQVYWIRGALHPLELWRKMSRKKKKVKSTFLIYSPQRAQNHYFSFPSWNTWTASLSHFYLLQECQEALAIMKKSTWNPKDWPSRADSILPSIFQIPFSTAISPGSWVSSAHPYFQEKF